MIVAHNAITNQKFHRLFEQRQIKKTYRAIVSGLMASTEEFQVDTPVQQQSAITRIKVLAQNTDMQKSLVEVKPETGRKHQIRVHLFELGHPVVNDRQYGSAPFAGDLQLQASALEFTPPEQQNILQISLPQDKLLTLPIQESP